MNDELWRTKEKDAAFGRVVKQIIESLGVTTTWDKDKFCNEIERAFNRVYGEDKDNG
jgi:hypothetical protein